MPITQADLRPVSTLPAACKICGGISELFDCLDFSRSCEEARGRFLPRSGVAVYYRRCTACGFICTHAFDDWPQALYETFIYNESYLEVDPDFASARPETNAAWLIRNFSSARDEIRLLDWGGGNGLLTAKLREAGFPVAETYDPFTPEFSAQPTASFNLITCYETLEHVSDPLATIGAIAARLADPGVVLFATLLQPEDIDRLRLRWWYAGPRNGHISLFSRPALVKAWSLSGLRVVSLSEGVHVAFRNLPQFFPRTSPDKG